MKKFLLGSVALVALSVGGPALAADMPAYKAAPYAAPAYYNWSGYYIGFNIGGQWDTVNRTFPNPTSGGFVAGLPFGTESRDGIFGFHTGLQYQWGAWVLGVEAALSAGFHEMRGISGVLPVGNPGFGPGLTGEHKVTNIFTVGPKLGYAFGNWMVYGTGGYATADLKGTFCVAATDLCGAPTVVNTGNGQSRNHGWYAGGGVDYMVHKGTLVDVIVGAEYQHWDVSRERAFCFNAACTGGGVYDLDAHGDIFRAKLTIKYNPWAAPSPVYAKY